jgi:hypothetical protein
LTRSSAGGVQAIEVELDLGRVRQADLGFLDAHRQPVAGALVDQAAQAVQLGRLGGVAHQVVQLADALAGIGLVDGMPGRQVEVIARRDSAPDAACCW